MTALRFGFCALGAALLMAAAGCAADTVPGADKALQDLAKRLKVGVDEITVEKVEPVTWRDGSLGLPRPGMMYTMALVPGARLEFKSPQGTYFYHVGGARAVYAGRAELWDSSALYLEPVENEPNGNGNLWQVSLLGTNPVPLLRGVTSFAPQPNGAVLATRRLSRSEVALLYLAPEAAGEAQTLAEAFDFACPVLSPQGDQYAVFVQHVQRTEGVGDAKGGRWEVVRRPLAEGTPADLPKLPSAAEPPVSLTWGEGQPLEATVRTDPGLRRFKLVEKDGVGSWEDEMPPPDEPGFSVLLNRSYTLMIATSTAADPPQSVTRVYTKHFMGEEKDLAVLADFAMARAEVTPDLQFALVSGKLRTKDTAMVTYTVDLRTGENWETIHPTPGLMRLLARPSHWGNPLQGE